MKNDTEYDLRTPVWRRENKPRRVKTPGEPRGFDGEDLVRAGTLSRKASENDTLTLEILDARDLDSDDLWDENDNIAVTEIYEQNEKEVNAIYLNTVAKGTAGFSSQ